ncbi:hypothetical protein QQZ08_003620 [Neonectria magnoliae]|uniref:NACHT domain-containing protein n=1 Tax=Neonectria magnoliae TaxID=2732573 RepID=A0ABR1I8H3_9HYPO
MSDPLSIAGSIAGLISLADLVFRAVFKYTRAVRDAKTNIDALANEINYLGTDLRHLYALVSELETERNTFEPTLRMHHLSHCDNTLSNIKKRVDKASASFARSKVISVTRQLKWPFSTSETKGLLDDLSRHKQSINAALSADTLRKLQLTLSKTDEIIQQVTSVEDIVKRIEIKTQITVDNRKQKILDYFIEISPRSRLGMSVKLRHPMTGFWLTNSLEFLKWLETPNSRLWLSGIPGAGKTVLAGAVIQEALNHCHGSKEVGVGYFCDYKTPVTGDPVNILGAIAHQLALQKPEVFEVLCQYYDELHPPNHLPTKPDPVELRAKISEMAELFDQTVIVVDGLDECDDNTDDVVKILVDLAEYSDNMSMALFSRDHLDIRIHLEDNFKHIPIAARTDDVKDEIMKTLV